MAEAAHKTVSLFVTGTDTGVGKTLVSAALLHALAKRHLRVVGMKPVAAGTESIDGVEANEDVLALRAASTCRVPPELDNPVLLPDPVSPHIAAARAGVRIDIAQLVACYRQLALLADAVVVEGAGGFHVPLSSLETGADLAEALDLPVVLVVGLRLGCLNHALLTAEAIRSRGLTLAGWVANHIDPDMLAQDDNIAFLQKQLQAPLLATVPWQAGVDARNITIHLPAEWQ
ncbi:dethiobiotin synthetase [Polaromonas sp. YR568]|uniref:dethiobiotin synthase n=1 Tax=Polaromonas sp. YR568 TaxID=1855301 RepID=UPI0008E8B934|nr:dethiobiotin synthase [Polaromonas sp. YR568]SFU63018.1 dethiobiotin synthetase [Polaromonas sp. YR568]